MKRSIKILGVSALIITTALAPFLMVQSALAAPDMAVSMTGLAGTSDPFSYTVQPSDSLSVIANTYGTTVAAIMALNPQITDPSLIYPGELLQIPQGVVVEPIIPLTGSSVVVTPEVNTPGSTIRVSVSNFPDKTPILVSVHPLNSTLVEVKKRATTNANGKVVVSMKIPSSGYGYYSQAWVARVSTISGTSLSMTSNQFIVETSVYPYATNGTFRYAVRSGDTLSLIAQRYGLSIATILAYNPQITRSSTLYSGELLTIPYGFAAVPPAAIIPLTGPSVVIVPNSGPQSTYIQVVLRGFPANTSVEVGLHKLSRKLVERTADATTDDNGYASISMRIPHGGNVDNNRVWLAQVTTTSGTSITVTSNPFYVTGN
jgi:LysM repeat protein